MASGHTTGPTTFFKAPTRPERIFGPYRIGPDFSAGTLVRQFNLLPVLSTTAALRLVTMAASCSPSVHSPAPNWFVTTLDPSCLRRFLAGSPPVIWSSAGTVNGSRISLIQTVSFGAAARTEASGCNSRTRRNSRRFPAGRRTENRLLTWSAQPGMPWKILLVSAQGGPSQELLQEKFNQLDPSWSPDGNRLVFARLSTPRSSEPQAIFTVDMNTHQVSTVPGSEGLFSPRWSPDGRFLAAVFGADQTKLMIFDFQTQHWSDWTTTPAVTGFLSWSRDGKYLYFDTLVYRQACFRPPQDWPGSV